MTETELGEMTPRTFQNMTDGWNELTREKELGTMVLLRWQTASLMNATGNFKKEVKAREIFPIPEIDNKMLKAQVATEEEKKKIIEHYGKIFKD